MNSIAKERVCAYCRVSTQYASQTDSHAAQIVYYTKIIRSNPHWTFAGVYADEGVSATAMKKRLGFQQLLKDCEMGKIDRILVKSITRFARNTLDCLTVVRQLKTLGVAVYFENESIDTGQLQGELLLAMFSSVAQEESMDKSRNIRWRIQKDFKQGLFRQSTMPYGYGREDGAAFIPQKEEAAVVNDIFHRFLNGASTGEIARSLNQAQIPSPKKKRWTAQQIKKMLGNERYTGELLLQKEYRDSNFIKRPNQGEYCQYAVTGAHTPIIEPEIFQKAQALLGGKTKPYQRRDHLFSGKLQCGLCGSPYSVKVSSENELWYCTKKYHEDCPNNSISVREINGAFAQMAKKLQQNNMALLKRIVKDSRPVQAEDQEQTYNIKRTKELIKLLKNSDPSQLPDQKLFIGIVGQIKVLPGKTMAFHLINSLVFQEKNHELPYKKRCL